MHRQIDWSIRLVTARARQCKATLFDGTECMVTPQHEAVSVTLKSRERLVSSPSRCRGARGGLNSIGSLTLRRFHPAQRPGPKLYWYGLSGGDLYADTIGVTKKSSADAVTEKILKQFHADGHTTRLLRTCSNN